MKGEVMELVAKTMAEAHYDVIITAFEEQEHKFPITMCMIDFMANLREKGIVYDIGDVFNSILIDKMYVEAGNYIGK